MIGRRPILRRTLAVAFGLILLVAGAYSVWERASERAPQDGMVWVDRPDLGLDWVVAESVDPEGPAARAGLRMGDRLRAIGSLPVARAHYAEDKLASAPPGKGVDLLIERSGEPRMVTLVPDGERTAGALDHFLSFVGFLFLAAAIWAGLRRRPQRAQLTLALLCGAVAALLLFSWTGRAATIDWVFYWLDRVARLAVPVLFLALGLVLAKRASLRRRLLPLTALPAAALLVARVALVTSGEAYLLDDQLEALGVLDRLELAVFAAYVAGALVYLGLSYSRAVTLSYRVKTLWLFWGTAVGFGPFVLAYLVPTALSFTVPTTAALSALTLVLAPFAFTAALLEYRLMDLRLVLRRTLSSAATAAFLLSVFFGLWTVLDQLLPQMFSRVGYLSYLLAGLATGLLFPTLRTAANHLVGRLYYRERYGFRRALLSFGQELNAELDLDRLVERLCRRLGEGLELEAVTVLLRADDGSGFVSWSDEGRGERIPGSEVLAERVGEVSYLTLAELMAVAPVDELRPLGERGVRYLIPMRLEGEVIAVLAVGARRPGEPLDADDLDLLVALSGHAAAAFASAQLIQQVHAKVAEVERLRLRTENIVNSSQIGLVVFDGDGVVRLWNPALERIYGLTAAEAVGRTFRDLFPLHLVRRVERAFAGEHASSEMAGRLYRVRLADRSGAGRVVNLALSDMPGEEGRTWRMVAFDDITPQIAMEEQAVRNDRLASIGMLAAGVAHEVNTPLTGISSYAQLLLEGTKPGDPRRSFLEKIVAQTERASHIANSLLDFSHGGQGDESPVLDGVSLADVVRDSAGLIRPQLRRTGVRLEIDLDEDVTPVLGDRGRLQQVVLNLLLNARDAIGGEGRIDLTLRDGPDGPLLEVADDGVGIPEEDRSRIFDPFFTTKGRGSGTGLGLALSHKIVLEHGGEIAVQSEVGKGTTFTVALPRRPEVTAGAGSHRDAVPDTGSEA